MGIDKDSIRRSILEQLDATRTALVAAQRGAQSAATHEESRAEGDKDMRSTELSYLARGQAMRVEALETERARVAAMRMESFDATRPIGMSALVTVETDDGPRCFFLAPGGAGLRVAVDGTTVDVVTIASPMGAALVGAVVGDSVVVKRGRQENELEIVDVA